MKKDITALFCFVDDFLQVVYQYEAKHHIGKVKKPTRKCSMSMTEVVTIILMYYSSKMSCFKHFYLLYLPLYKGDFSVILSYNRFIELKPRALFYLNMLLQYLCSLGSSDVHYIDATSLAVCHGKRISQAYCKTR